MERLLRLPHKGQVTATFVTLGNPDERRLVLLVEAAYARQGASGLGRLSPLHPRRADSRTKRMSMVSGWRLIAAALLRCLNL